MESKFNKILNGILTSIKVGISLGDNIQVSKSRNEILLPSHAGHWDNQIMIDVNEIQSMRTEDNWDYYLLLKMYDGQRIKIKYSFASRRKMDLNKIMKMRDHYSGYSPRPAAEFYFEF